MTPLRGNGTEFEIPTSLRNARTRRQALNDEARKIEMQLSSSNREVDGKRMSSYEYHTWRDKAVYALGEKRRESTWLKRWIDDNRPGSSDDQLISDHPANLIRSLNRAYGKLVKVHEQVERFLQNPDSDLELDKLREAFEDAQSVFAGE